MRLASKARDSGFIIVARRGSLIALSLMRSRSLRMRQVIQATTTVSPSVRLTKAFVNGEALHQDGMWITSQIWPSGS